jgi:acetyl-CoA C-acetyltransferase
MSQEDIVIVGMARTPMGGLLGELANLSASELGAVAVKAAVKEAGVKGADTIFMGNVLSAGLGQAPARQAALKAGLDKGTQAVTLNKMCGSGLQAVAMGRQALLSGESDVVIAGGMESMTRAPFLMQKHRGGQKYGHDKLYDHMALDGLEDAYEGNAMGVYADAAAKEYQFTRESQDAFALETLKRAQSATAEGRFKREIAPIELKTGNLDTDELPRKARPDKIP